MKKRYTGIVVTPAFSCSRSGSRESGKGFRIRGAPVYRGAVKAQNDSTMTYFFS
jgi:hypothetical protein